MPSPFPNLQTFSFGQSPLSSSLAVPGVAAFLSQYISSETEIVEYPENELGRELAKDLDAEGRRLSASNWKKMMREQICALVRGEVVTYDIDVSDEGEREWEMYKEVFDTDSDSDREYPYSLGRDPRHIYQLFGAEHKIPSFKGVQPDEDDVLKRNWVIWETDIDSTEVRNSDNKDLAKLLDLFCPSKLSFRLPPSPASSRVSE